MGFKGAAKPTLTPKPKKKPKKSGHGIASMGTERMGVRGDYANLRRCGGLGLGSVTSEWFSMRPLNSADGWVAGGRMGLEMVY